MTMHLSLENRTAVVTGGTRGLGRAVARAFSKAGALVIIAARGAEALSKTAQEISHDTGNKVLACPCDIATADGCAELHSFAEHTLPGVDILVNNAGSSRRGAFESLTDEDWQGDLDLKLFAAIRLCRYFLPGMRERGWGRVLNTVSIVGKVPGGGGAPTNVSRAAGIALSKMLSQEYAQYGVTVNALCPGRIRTSQWERFWQRDAPELDYETFLDTEGKKIPAGRLGEDHEFAAVATFLASDAGAYVNGVAINIDGGLCPVV
jgi:3-oxoacyl-[acyl-carrier protein] reductase